MWCKAVVNSVDVSFDGGQTWTQAALEPRSGRAGQRIIATWRPDQLAIKNWAHERPLKNARNRAGAELVSEMTK